MKCKKACLVINPRGGQNLARLTDVMAVFAAAGWKTDIAIKEYGGHTMELGTQAAEKNYDLVIAYGGERLEPPSRRHSDSGNRDGNCSSGGKFGDARFCR